MKVFCLLCIILFSSLVTAAAQKEAQLQPRLQSNLRVTVRSAPADRDAETLHLPDFNWRVSQYRQYINDNIISDPAVSPVIANSTVHPYLVLFRTTRTASLSRLLLFPNHYFW